MITTGGIVSLGAGVGCPPPLSPEELPPFEQETANMTPAIKTKNIENRFFMSVNLQFFFLIIPGDQVAKKI